MTRLVTSEILKLVTTRSTILVALGAVALAALLGAANVATAAEEGTNLGSAAFVENVVGVSTVPALAALLLGVLLAAGEHQHHTITTTYLVTPRRVRVVVAKASAGAVGGVGIALAMVAAASATALAGVALKGGSAAVSGRAGIVLAGLLCAAGLLGALGTFLGAIVRSQVAAVVTVAAWVLILEGVIDVLAGGGLRTWMPGGAAADLAGASDRPLWSAGLLVLAWTAAMALVAIPLTTRRDVA